jgi:hypothetical protein
MSAGHVPISLNAIVDVIFDIREKDASRGHPRRGHERSDLREHDTSSQNFRNSSRTASGFS